MALSFKKYGLLATDNPRVKRYRDNWGNRINPWVPVWWWPMNWLLLGALWYVALLVIGGEGEPE